jgi:hypothetical protein
MIFVPILSEPHVNDWRASEDCRSPPAGTISSICSANLRWIAELPAALAAFPPTTKLRLGATEVETTHAFLEHHRLTLPTIVEIREAVLDAGYMAPHPKYFLIRGFGLGWARSSKLNRDSGTMSVRRIRAEPCQKMPISNFFMYHRRTVHSIIKRQALSWQD